MIDGISVAITTFNGLKYLKKCLHSIEKYSGLSKTEASIFVDGSTDGTIEWLKSKEIPFDGRKENVGQWSGWNNAIKNCQNEYFLQGQDDTFFGPEWDLKLATWIEELSENYIIMPQLVEPTFGSYPPPYDCGRTIDAFNEERFINYCRKHANRHETIAHHMGFWTMKKTLFFSIGGFDEFYDPVYRGDGDFLVRLSHKYPKLRWVRVWDSMIYHFPPKFHRKQSQHQLEVQKRNAKHFQEKYGLKISEAYASIPIGVSV